MKSVATVLNKKPRSSVDTFKVEWPLMDQLMGIEIEIDSINDTVFPDLDGDPSWTGKRDGSLRNGREYVLTQPLSGDLLSRAISSFFSRPQKVYKTATGSTHIHMDMLEADTPVQSIQVLTILFFMLEPAIFAMYAPEREWCGYTNKLSSAPEALLGSVLNLNLENGLPVAIQSGSIGRYYGFNIQALFKFGSVELRYFPTATTRDELIEWLTLAQCFKQASLSLRTTDALRQIMDDENSYHDFLRRFFGQWYERIIGVVPYYSAQHAFNKAQAIASAYQYSNKKRVEPPSMDNLFKRGRFSKFAKKSKDALERGVDTALARVITVSSSDRAPEAGNHSEGTVMLYGDYWYMSTRLEGHTMWSRISANTHRNDMSGSAEHKLAVLRRAKAAMYGFNVEGRSSSAIARRDACLAYFDTMIRMLEQELRDLRPVFSVDDIATTVESEASQAARDYFTTLYRASSPTRR